jgi:hypothetical protein
MNFSFYIKNKLEAEIVDALDLKGLWSSFVQVQKCYGKISITLFKAGGNILRQLDYKYPNDHFSGPLVEIKEISKYLKTL